MCEFDLDEISIIEKTACIDSIVGMMDSFGISLDDIKCALTLRQSEGRFIESTNSGIAMDTA